MHQPCLILRLMLRWGSATLALSWLLFSGCGDDSASSITGPDSGTAKIDTSTLAIERLTHTAYDADGEIRTGLTLQWRLSFHSTTGRECRIRSYTLTDDRNQVVYRGDTPSPEFVKSGDDVSGKVTWIPIARPTSAGDYRFTVSYETGYYITDFDERSRWNGPLSDGAVSQSFTATPTN